MALTNFSFYDGISGEEFCLIAKSLSIKKLSSPEIRTIFYVSEIEEFNFFDLRHK